MSYATRAQTHAFMEQWEQSLDDARKAVTVKRDYVRVSPPSVRLVVREKLPSASSKKPRPSPLDGMCVTWRQQGYLLMGDALMSMQRCAEALYVYQRGLKVRPDAMR